MKLRTRRYARDGLIAFGLFLLACWIVPSFFSAERYRHRLEAGLERALNRTATFGAVTYRLLPRPGFSIENAVVREDPAFGFEPFARVDRIDCDLRWRSLLHSRLDCARLFLERPSFNLVRNTRGEWNVESFMQKNGLAAPGRSGGGTNVSLENLDLHVDDARIDFSMGSHKKPFAITGLDASLNFDRHTGLLAFRLEGSPIRTDLSLPSPGLVRLEGQWTPGANLEGPLDASLRSQEASLYDWIPLLTGHNPEVYGIFDTQVHLTGSLHHPRLEGNATISQLHRWGDAPPSDPMPSTLFFRGQFDRTRGRAEIESLDATFADSHIHLTGSIDQIPWSPELDLVVAVERSRLEDFVTMAHRFSSRVSSTSVSGRMDGLVAIQGPWKDRHYSGFVGARGILITTSAGNFPVSDVDVRIEKDQAHLAPVRILMAPHVELTVEGAIAPSVPIATPRRVSRMKTPETVAGPKRYEISLAAKSAPLHDLVNFGRALGFISVQGLDAHGLATATFTLSGQAWPVERPVLDGSGDVRAASLLVPGITELINIPRAHFQVTRSHVVADPVVAILGTSVFTSRFEHQGDRALPWQFDVRANTLSLEQGSLWFDALGRRQGVPLLERLPGLSSSGELRAAASNFFGALNARGQFTSPTVTYRSLTLTDFQTSVEITGRVIKLSDSTFRAGGGYGRGKLDLDLRSAPARVTLDVSMADGNLQSLASRLPAQLRDVRGTFSGDGHFETRGLSHEETLDNLQGSATVHLKNIFLGDFDPLQAVARQSGWGTITPARGEASIRAATATLEVHDRRVMLGNLPLDMAGAKLKLTGACNFDGALELDVRSDFSHITRRWSNIVDAGKPSARTAEIHLAGRFSRLAVTPQIAESQVKP